MANGEDTRYIWSEEATLVLLNLWEENITGLRGTRKNQHIYMEMAEKLKKFGPSCKEVKTKMDNLQRKYKTELAKVGPSGGAPSTWEYFEMMSAILGKSHSVNFKCQMRESDSGFAEPVAVLETEHEDETPKKTGKKRKRDLSTEFLEIERQKLELEKEKVKLFKQAVVKTKVSTKKY